jgi:hypothetical protein
MNKSIAYALALAAVSSVALADTASVNFATGSSAGLPTALVTGSGQFAFDSAGIHSANYVAQLFYSTDGTSFSAVSTQQPFFNVTASSVRAGTWKSASFSFPAAVSAGDTVTLRVGVWDSTLFSSWDAAVAEKNSLSTETATLKNGDHFQIGSSTFTYKTPAAGDLNPADFNMSNFTGFGLTAYTVVTPEPSVVALGALGLGALLWRRRSSK